MVSSKQVPLSEAYWFQEGPGVRNWQFTTSGVKLLNVGNITKDGNIDLDKTDKHISLDEAEGNYSHFLVDEGDLVIASSGISFDEDGMLRTRGAFIEKKHLPLCLNTSTIRFKAIDGVSDLDFFKFWLDSFEFRDQVSRLVTGSAQQNFGPSHLKAINISLPPLTEQKRIASLLARADRLRHLRRTAHELGESLLQSVFLEMFGDIERNEKGWEKYPISKYVNVQGGYSFKSEDFIKSGVKVVKITNVHYGHLTWQDDTEFLPVEYLDKYSAFSLKTGDIVMSLTRPIIKSLDTVKVCRVQESDTPCLLNQRVGRLIIKNSNKIVPEYLLHFCYSQHFKKKVDDFLSESLQPNISINQVGEIEIPVPPLNLQEEFAGVVARVESLRERMSESERQVEGLFESLLAEAFS